MVQKKVMVLVLMALAMVGAVDALQTIPVTIDVTVDFKGERDFSILMPNGLERHFYWDQNQSHSDTSFKHIIYYEVDEVSFCKKYADLGTYINLSEGMVGMLDVCQGAMKSWNDSVGLREQMNQAIRDRDIVQGLLKVCKADLDKEENFTMNFNKDMQAYRTEADKCKSQLSVLQQSNQECQECTTNLEEAVSSKSNSLFLGVGLGVGVGYFLWKRKKEADAPSEQAETGARYDSVSPSSRPDGLRFRDGPRE